MSKILVSGGLVPTTKDTLLDARTRVATFADIANIENPARFMVITVEETGKKYEVRKLSSKIIGGIVVENSTIDINDPEALVDLGLAEELRSEDEKVRQSNESKRIEAENLRKSAEDSRKVNETNRVSAEGVRETSERTRVTSEDTRNANEQTRNSNETKRQSQESTRQSQESARQNNESVRNTNESARKEAESERKTEETSRRTAELSRSSAENTRAKNEQNRTTAENTRSSAEDRRSANETQRTANETARSNAELSREQAEGNRASTFETLKGRMQTTIQEGQTAVAATEKATSDAEKVVDEYDTKVAEQDSKLSELGTSVNANRYGYNVTINGLKGGVHNIESAINDVPSKYRMLGQKITFRTENGDWATYHNESLSLDSYTDVNDWKQDTGIGQVAGDVNIKNEPDYEDLTESKDNKLKFADKEYNYDSNSGLGRVYLRKNVVGDANVFTQEMISKSNTEYIIQYDYDLQGENITIPENCVLNFNGGSFKNGIINGDNIQIVNKLNNCILNKVKGNYKIQEAPFSWFMYEESDNIVESLNYALEHTHRLLIEEGVYNICRTIRPQSNQTIEGLGKVVLVSEINAYDYNTNAEKDGSIVNVALVAVRGVEDGIDYSKYPSASGDYVYGKGIALAPNNVYNQNYVIVANKNEISNINSGDWLLVSSGLGYWHYVTQEMALVDYIEGNYIYFKNALRYSYSTERYSLSNWYKEYDVVAQPGGTTVGYPDFSTFETCCVRKITPKENILIKNVTLDISSNSSVSNLGLLIMLGRNIKTDNVEIINGRLWTCDSQDIHHSCLKTNYNSYIGNGSNNINAYQCEFNGGLQIEEGCSNCTLMSCEGVSNSVINSIIGSSKNISLISCRFNYCLENNSTLRISKSKNILILNSEISGGSSAVAITDPFWSETQNNPLDIDGYKALSELTDYYDSNVTIIGGKLKSYGSHTSLYNKSLRYAYMYGTDIANLATTMYVYGSYTSNKKSYNVFRDTTIKGNAIINDGKGHIQGLLHLSAQLDLTTQKAISRGLWSGENNGSGTEIEGSKDWTALGVRNQGDENALLKNNTEFGLFHLNNEDFLRFKMGAGQYYRMILNDGSVPNFTEENTPSVDRYGVGVPLFMSDKQRPVYKAFRYENGEIVENSYYGYDGYSYLYNRVGFTEERPHPNNRDAGFRYYDKTINKPIWWTGSTWVDATGATV